MMDSGEHGPVKGHQNRMKNARIPKNARRRNLKPSLLNPGVEKSGDYIKTSRGIRRVEPKIRMSKKERRRERDIERMMKTAAAFEKKFPLLADYAQNKPEKLKEIALTIIDEHAGGDPNEKR